MRVVDLIIAKRDGGALTDEEISWFIAGYTAGEIADHQAAALLMAIVFQGLDGRELTTWTQAMIDSGERTDLSTIGRPTVDKHSTGGVGDKVSLVLCPLVAACGAAVPQVSGRGLGHTGGTLDKLATIPGWRAELTAAQMRRQLHDVGAVIITASETLAPADRKLYALRDITGTVPSVPLIASSIMAKKIASGTDRLVLDVKVGSAAFLTDETEVRRLAATMVDLGDRHGVRTRALLTEMSTPLGAAVGNALEVAEAVECLAGGGPADLRELTLTLGDEMLELAGIDADIEAALDDGRAMDVWRRMIRAQGGDPDAALPASDRTETIDAPASGFVQQVDALGVGRAAWHLGAGRADQTEAVSAIAGVTIQAKPGLRVQAGDPVLTLHVDDPARIADARPLAEAAVTVGPEPPLPRALVIDRMGA